MPDASLVALADQYADQIDLPREVAHRWVNQESRWNPRAFNAKSGASGIMQIIPRWHPGVDVWNPVSSMAYAFGWLSDLKERYGGWARAFAAYNWGPGNVEQWDGSSRTLPEETRTYLNVILQNWDVSGTGGGEGTGEGAVPTTPEERAKSWLDTWGEIWNQTRTLPRDMVIDRVAGPALSILGGTLILMGLGIGASRAGISFPPMPATVADNVVTGGRGRIIGARLARPARNVQEAMGA